MTPLGFVLIFIGSMLVGPIADDGIEVVMMAVGLILVGFGGVVV